MGGGGVSAPAPGGFVPPPYPFDRLDGLRALATAHDGGVVDLSVGTPCDSPPEAVMAALADPVAARGYPPSVGTPALRRAAAGWMARRFGVEVDERAVATCVGTKELVAGLPTWLRLRWPQRDVVLHPAVAYPSYAMGATLAGAQAVPVPARSDGTSDLAALPEELWARALVLWVNSPANPTGRLDDLDRVVAEARARGVLVASDECYAEFVWTGEPATALRDGTRGVLAVHSLSKRSNMAGLRAGFYAGDEDLVAYLSELRKHAGFMVPGPVQAAMVAALEDDVHVELQRARYLERLEFLVSLLASHGYRCSLPDGAFYVWATKDGERAARVTGWDLAEELANSAGILASPGELYEAAPGWVRLAAVQPMDRLRLAGERMDGERPARVPPVV